MSNYTISPEQSAGRIYRAALDWEIQTSKDLSAADLANLRINHPTILKYKAELLGGDPRDPSYSAWSSAVLAPYGRRGRSLALGSGLGRIENHLIEAGIVPAFETIELNREASSRARASNQAIHTAQGDLNFLELEESVYDFILCHGVLHHLINLEEVLYQVDRALTADGLLLIYEYVGPSRWQFGQETMDLLQATCPGARFRVPKPWEFGGFESIRSADLVPLLRRQWGETTVRTIDYGAAYFPFVVSAVDYDENSLPGVLDLDRRARAERIIPPCYHMGLYRKSSSGRQSATPWSDAELREHLLPDAPLPYRFRRKIRRTRLGGVLRGIKNFIGS